MSDKKNRANEVAATPWHLEELPRPASKASTDREYLPVAGHKASADTWAALRDLLEFDDGSKRIGAAEAAKRLGVSPQQLYRWLSGPTNMRIETAGKVAAALEANLEIIAVPWESLAVQNYVHSFSSCRLENRTAALNIKIKSDVGRGVVQTIVQKPTSPKKNAPSYSVRTLKNTICNG